MHILILGIPARAPFMTPVWQVSQVTPISSVWILCGKSIGWMGFGRMLRKSFAAASKLGCAVVNVGELHRFAIYGSPARVVYPGTFACCTQPATTAALKNKIAIRTSPEKLPHASGNSHCVYCRQRLPDES